jgi:hypothetical protein
MKHLRRAIVAAAAVSILFVPGAGTAEAAPTKEPDCTWTNDNVAVCKYADGSSICYDHYGKKVACPATRTPTNLSVVSL